MTTQIQRRRGTTAQHSTFTGAEAELTVDTTKDTVVVHDGSTVGGRPLLREDQSNLPTSAPTTGIYNASGSLAISTNGTGKLFINSSGVIEGYNTQSTGAGIVTGLRLNSARATGGDGTEITFNLDFPGYSALAGIAGVFSGGGNNGHLIFKTVNSGTYAERLRITSAGLVGVGTSTPSRQFQVSSASGSSFASVVSGNASADVGYLFGTTSSDALGQIIYDNSTNSLRIATNSTERLRIDSSGRLGVGTTTVGHTLEVRSSSSDGNFFVGNASGPGLMSGYSGGATASYLQAYNTASSAFIDLNINGSSVRFGTGSGATERARIDSSGRLLVGTSTTSGVARTVIQGYVGDNNGLGLLQLQVGSTSPGFTLGRIDFTDSNSNAGARFLAERDGGTWTSGSSHPTRLVFSTCGDGASSPTERMRIQQNGFVKVANNGNHVSTTDAVHRFESDNASNPYLTLRAQNANYAGEGLQLRVNRAANSVYWFLAGQSSDGGDNEFVLKGDGNAFADGSWSGGGADYAEYFEWADSNPSAEDRRGISVVLDGDKIRKAQPGEDPIGVISGNPSVVGDAAWNKWSGKYLRDEYGTYTLDENGDRQLNPAYDPDVEYISREQRPEWDCVGLMGKLRIRKGQATGSRWIKMRDISNSVEEWLVR